jgi:hypothetical protein
MSYWDKYEKITLKKEPKIVLNKEMKKFSYQVVYSDCPIEINHMFICPCVPLHIVHGTSLRTWRTAPISLPAHLQRTFLAVCTNDVLWLITIFFSCIGLDAWIPFHFLRSLFPVSCLPRWNDFRFLKDSSNFLFYGEHVSISAELLDRPCQIFCFSKSVWM